MIGPQVSRESRSRRTDYAADMPKLLAGWGAVGDVVQVGRNAARRCGLGVEQIARPAGFPGYFPFFMSRMIAF